MIGNKIKYLREELGLRQSDLADKLSISPSAVGMYERNARQPNNDLIIKLAKFFNVSTDYLLGNSDIRNESNVFPIADTPVRVPVVGKISAGKPILAQENIEGYEFAPSSQIKEGQTYFYLRVQGDSMNLKFNDGDIVLVQKQDYLENNEIGVFIVNGYDATVKKYKRENNLIILEPMSNNPNNTVQIYNENDDFHIIGKVISYQGKV